MPGLADKLSPFILAVGVAEVSRRSRVTRQSIQRFLAGKQNLNEKKLQAIANAVGCRIVVQKPKPVKNDSDPLADMDEA